MLSKKTQSIRTIIAAFSFFFVSFHPIGFANQTKDQTMRNALFEEIKQLSENLKEYSKAKTNTYQKNLENILKGIQTEVDHSKEKVKEGFQERYNEIYKEYQQLKTETTEKQEEMYKKLLNQLKNLNEDIEKSTKEEKNK